MGDVDIRVHIFATTPLERLIDIISFNDGNVLHPRSETIAVYRQMNMVLDDYNDQG